MSLDHFDSVQDLDHHWQTESRALDQGVAVQSCEYCWQAENEGHLSFRQMPRVLSTDSRIEIYVDNACNQMCSYCSPRFSSTWQSTIQQNGNFVNISATARQNLSQVGDVIHSQLWLDRIRNYIDQQHDNAVTVKLLGGEPLMQFRQLETLIGLNIDKVKQLRINTNLNPPSNKFLLWLLDRVPASRLVFDISIDATPDFNHVPRAGFDKLKFCDNLALIKQAGIAYNFLSTLSVLNLFDIGNYINWCRNFNHKFEILPLNNPDCLRASLVPYQFRAHVQVQDAPALVAEALQPTHATVDLELFEQYNYLNQYFQRSGVQPENTTNPEFNQYWQWLQERYQ